MKEAKTIDNSPKYEKRPWGSFTILDAIPDFTISDAIPESSPINYFILKLKKSENYWFYL